MDVSVRILAVMLIVPGLVLTAFLCTLLGVLSADRAVNDTQHSRDEGLGACFDTGSRSSLKQNADVLDLVSTRSVENVVEVFDLQTSAARALTAEFMAYSQQKRDDWLFLRTKRAHFFNLFKTLWPKGCTGLGYVSDKEMSLRFYEDSRTISYPPNAFHHFITMSNNGSAYDYISGIPAKNRTARSTALEPDGRLNGDIEAPFIPPEANRECNLGFTTNGTEGLDSLCYFTNYDHKSHFWWMTAITPFGPENVRWSDPFFLPGGFLAMVAIGTMPYDNGDVQSLFFVGLDVNVLDLFLKRFKLGTPSGRIFLNFRSSVLYPGSDAIVGVSHGSTKRIAGYQPSSAGDGSLEPFFAFRRPNESNDEIVQRSAEVVYGYRDGTLSSFEALLQRSSPYEYNITTSFLPSPTAFFIKTALVDGGSGIDWYCNVIIDREHVLGEIDRQVVSVQMILKESEDRIQDAMEEDRMILYVVVCVVAAVFTATTVAVVYMITAPLLTLKDEMCYVASMKLELVNEDRALSRLSEVRNMQISFLQMLSNLREYRNYMPQSLLQGETSEEEAEEVSRQSSKSTGLKSHSSKVQDGPMIHMVMKAKNISLAAVNIKKFHSISSDMAKLHTKHAEYVSLVLKEAAKMCGVPDSFSGDRVTVGWNAAKSTVRHAVKAASFCVAMRSCTLPVSSAIIGGSIKIGNMGCEGMKKFAHIGGRVSFLYLLERLNQKFETNTLLCPTTASEIEHSFAVRAVEHLMYKKYSTKPFTIFRLLEKLQVSAANTEWMYQLQEDAEHDPNKKYNAAFEQYTAGDFTTSLDLIVGDPDVSRVQERVTFCQGKGKLPHEYMAAISLDDF